VQSLLSKKVEISWQSAATRWLALALVAAVLGPGSVYAMARRAGSQTAVVQPSDQGIINTRIDRFVILPVGTPELSVAMPISAQPSPTATDSPTPTATGSPTVIASASASATVARNGVLLTHVVKNGESLSLLANQYQVSEDTIRWANSLEGNSLQNDQQLLIPPVSGVVYMVQNGDEIDDIAFKYQVDALVVLSANNLTNPVALESGTRLVIPGASPIDTLRSGAATRGDRQGQSATDRSVATSYEVLPGDNLSSIAEKFDVTVSAMFNGISRDTINFYRVLLT